MIDFHWQIVNVWREVLFVDHLQPLRSSDWGRFRRVSVTKQFRNLRQGFLRASDDKHRGRPASLSRENILEAAAQIPMKSFSVRAIADRLGVSPQSIYYYFENKNALLGALAEESVAQLPIIEAIDWRNYLRENLLLYRSWITSSGSPALEPDIASSWARLNDQPSEAILTRMEAFVDFFVRAGFTPHQAIEVWNLGTTLVVRSLVSRLEEADVDAHWGALRADVEALGVERFPSLSKALAESPPPVDDWFPRIVEIAIEGVAAVYGVD